jgi:hypothetical protein
MSDAKTAWSLFGTVFVRAMEETGKAISEATCSAGTAIANSTHEVLQSLADKTRPTTSNTEMRKVETDAVVAEAAEVVQQTADMFTAAQQS